MTTYLVSVYECEQAYGGAEEGAWWYDTGTLIRTVRLFKNEDKAYVYSRRLNDKLSSRAFGPNEGRREYSSVLSEGEFRAQVHEDAAPASFPETRPRYE